MALGACRRACCPIRSRCFPDQLHEGGLLDRAALAACTSEASVEVAESVDRIKHDLFHPVAAKDAGGVEAAVGGDRTGGS